MSFFGQVIVEREFKSREKAEHWMDRISSNLTDLHDATHVEQHLWEPARISGRSKRKVV